MAARRLWRWFAAVVAVFVLVLVVAVVFIYSGFYNVSALYPDPSAVKWVLGNTMDNSVKRHARGITVPKLNDPAMIRAGLGHYRDDCVACHGAPGVRKGEIGRGLNPDPPPLVRTAGDWTPAELFWLTKNGVRMTGMPAWGKIDKDEELWQTVAFVHQIHTMTPAQYKAMDREVPKE